MSAASAFEVRIVHLYADVMNVYGDRGNILALIRRAEWRGLGAVVHEVALGEQFNADESDLLFFGGGQDREQAAVSHDFLGFNAAAVSEAVEQGAALLSICGGYQLLGKSYTAFDGTEMPGSGLFDVRSVPGPRRFIGNALIETHLDNVQRTLVGFENHSGRTYLAEGVRPLGRVIVGAGNNGEDQTEGAVVKEAIGCYLHGSLLPKNPWLADRLLMAALRHRYGDDARPLIPLDDQFEMDAHAQVAARVRAGGRVRSGAW